MNEHPHIWALLKQFSRENEIPVFGNRADALYELGLELEKRGSI